MRILYFGIFDSDFSRNRIYMRALKNAGHEIIECRDNTRGLRKYLQLVRRLRALKGSYDVIIVGYPGHIVVPLARLFGAAPVVSDLLGSLSDAAKNTYEAGRIEQAWFSFVDRLAIAFSDAALVDSNSQKEYMTRRYGSGHKYHVVYTGADEDVFAPRGERDVARSGPFVALFRGRLIPESGILHIMDAAERLKDDDRFFFRIIGYGPLLGEVRDRASKLSNVELISEHISFDEMRRLMLDADVSLGQFGINDRSDRNLPHKAYESISMGIPYITANVRGISEILKNEVSSLMVPSANPEAIVTALERLRNDRTLGARLAQNARAAFESHASSRVIASVIMATCAECIEAKKKRTTSSFGLMGKREVIAMLILLALFVGIRLPGVELPYHQDEAKIGDLVRYNQIGALDAHPPLSELTWRKVGALTGPDNLRVIPLIFATISAVLLYAVVRRRAGIVAARVALGVYAVSMFGVFASLMVDTDGAILPTYFLLAVYLYDRFRDARSTNHAVLWLIGVCIAVLLGLLTKLSFVLVLGALVIDYVFEIRKRIQPALLIRLIALGSACALLGALALWAAQYVLSSFELRETIAHALSYMRFGNRGYLQIAIQAIKAVFYMSPFLLIPVFFGTKEMLNRMRIFAVYLAVGAVFYFALFDFSQGALDKYLMFIVVPIAALAGTVVARVIAALSKCEVIIASAIGAVISLALIGLNFLAPRVIPLYPKTQWISQIVHGKWNMLFAFTGGDGPIGVYLSFLFIALTFIVCAVLLTVARARIPSLLVSVLIITVTYNVVFVQEFLFGSMNGSARKALAESLSYVRTHDLPPVITHGEIGGYELKGMGKYAGRFYAVPGYEPGHRELFAKHTGPYLVVDVPRLNPESFYGKFFASCKPIFSTRSGQIDATIYDCTGVDPYSIQ